MIKAFLFDLDGVIVDTAHFHYQAWRRLSQEKLGFDITEEFNESLKGVSRTESLERILTYGGVELDSETKHHYATLKNDWYVAMVNQMTPSDILPGVVEFLRQTRNAKIKIGLGSVSKNARPILEHVGIVDMFDVIIDGNLIAKGKPDPEVFLKGAEALGLLPAECVVFEDAVAGIEAANNAAMKSVGIGKKEILSKANVVYPDLKQIKVADLLKEIDE